MPEKTDKAIESIKKSLKKQHPKWNEDKIDDTAWAIFYSRKQKGK